MTFYHNPRCSKCRQALKLLQQEGFEVEVVEYLKDPPDLATLERIYEALGNNLEAMSRMKDLTKDGLEPSLELIAREPRYLERPILVQGSRAVVGRPPERVLEFLKESALLQ